MEKFITKVIDAGEWFDTCPEFAVIEISDALLERIMMLRDEAERLGVYTITEFDDSANFHRWDEDEDGNECPGAAVRTDLHILNVSSKECWWTAHLKNCEQSFSSEHISICGRNEFLEHNLGSRLDYYDWVLHQLEP